MTTHRFLCISILSLISAGRAFADGTTDISINPATGATISKPGAYKLVSDATMTADVAAITVTSADVTLDLGGHTITATGGSGFSGIAATDQFTVFNGGLRYFGLWGITAGGQANVRNISVMFCNKNSNAGGIQLGDNAVVEDCMIKGNTGGSATTTGLLVGNNARISNNTIEDNDSGGYLAVGISTGEAALVVNNTVRGNDALSGLNASATGINVGKRAVVRGNVVTLQKAMSTGGGGATGINAAEGGVIESNVCADQGATGISRSAGISAEYCTIIHNDCIGNIGLPGSNVSGQGISASLSSVRGNRCSGNNGAGTGDGVGILLGVESQATENLCISNLGGATGFGWGVYVSSAGTFVATNVMMNNSTAAIVYKNSNGQRIQSNQMQQSVGIDLTHGSNPPSIGTGDLANVLF